MEPVNHSFCRIKGFMYEKRKRDLRKSFSLSVRAAVVILSLALTMELWLAVEASTKRFARALLLPGLGLQRITTREPRLEETRVALRAVESVLTRELST